MKFNNDQSSAKLFCRGVPVNRSLFSTGKYFNSLISLHFAFFNLCPFRKKDEVKITGVKLFMPTILNKISLKAEADLQTI
jgi:hypothetical protein